MALIIPISASTFGDGTKTEGRFQKYVLAQFRSDSDLEWVRRLRSRLVKAELKYTDFKEHRASLRKDKTFWESIEKGLGQATVIVIDPGQYEPLAKDTVVKADIERAGTAEKVIVDACAIEVLSGTPLAYLPVELHKVIPWVDARIASLDRFSPDAISAALGGSLRHAAIFAARAHALFDVPRLDSATSIADAFKSSRLARVILPEVLSTARYFDIEHPLSVSLLNEAVEVIATAVEAAIPEFGQMGDAPRVIETDSRGYDELQASDVAAGWARELLDLADTEALGARFERVWLNGTRVK